MGLTLYSLSEERVLFQTRRFFAALLCVTQEKTTQYQAKTDFDEAMFSYEDTPKLRRFLFTKKPIDTIIN